MTILTAAFGWLTTLSSARASLRNGCPKRHASLEFHGTAALAVAIAVEVTPMFIHFL